MTNRNMVSPGAVGTPKPGPNRDPLPSMPATEGNPEPVTDQEPPDSPQLEPDRGSSRPPRSRPEGRDGS